MNDSYFYLTIWLLSPGLRPGTEICSLLLDRRAELGTLNRKGQPLGTLLAPLVAEECLAFGWPRRLPRGLGLALLPCRRTSGGAAGPARQHGKDV